MKVTLQEVLEKLELIRRTLESGANPPSVRIDWALEICKEVQKEEEHEDL